METVLVLGIDPDAFLSFAGVLGDEGYKVTRLEDTRELNHQASDAQLVLIDYRLAARNGFEILSSLQQHHPEVGVILLSDSADAVDEILCLEVGADDYLIKSANPRVLIARIHSLLRRRRAAQESRSANPPVFRFDDYVLDGETNSLRRNGRQVRLSGTEFRLLRLFLERPGEVLTREVISQKVFGREWKPTGRHVDVLVGKLRRRLGDPSAEGCIRTYRGVGYQFAARVSRLSDTGQPGQGARTSVNGKDP